MMNFLGKSGLETFYRKLKEIFVTKESASEKYVSQVTATDDSVTFLNGKGKILCKIKFNGNVEISGAATDELDESDMDAIFDDDPRTTVTGGITDITDAELNPVFNGNMNVTVDGSEDFSADDIDKIFN